MLCMRNKYTHTLKLWIRIYYYVWCMYVRIFYIPTSSLVLINYKQKHSKTFPHILKRIFFFLLVHFNIKFCCQAFIRCMDNVIMQFITVITKKQLNVKQLLITLSDSVAYMIKYRKRVKIFFFSKLVVDFYF